MDEITQNMQIVCVACVDHNRLLHLTDIDIMLEDVNIDEYGIHIDNLVFPREWYHAIELLDKNGYEDLKRRLNLQNSQFSS
jgi:hypothetical protein